jgi:hypothetical protein
MADKKEVLDYLRNQQKAAEIDAKVNGVNLWVLVGALAIISWQLIDTVQSKLWEHPDIILRIILATLAIYYLVLACGPFRAPRNEIRYFRVSASDAPMLDVMQSLLQIIPTAVFFLFFKKSPSAFILGFFSFILILISAEKIWAKFVKDESTTEKYPKLGFAGGSTGIFFTNLIVFSLMLFALCSLLKELRDQTSVVLMIEAKTIALVSGFYLLLLITIHRKLWSHGTLWTYELETDLLLGAVTADVAIRKIENRALGPRLQDVMDRIADDLDKRFVQVDTRMAECRELFSTVSTEVPPHYPVERASRISKATGPATQQVEELLAECKAFSAYLKRITDRTPDAKRPGIASLLPSLLARHADYERRAKSFQTELSTLMSGA